MRRFSVPFLTGTLIAASAGTVGAEPPPLPTCMGLTVTIDAATLPPGDRVVGTTGPDVILGTEGDDQIVGRAGDDVICGLGGADTIRGGPGNDVISGGNGPDSIWGGDDDDVVYGGPGSDPWIGGGTGHDELYGEGGDDNMVGGTGDDLIDGGPGNDGGLPGQSAVLMGQAGVDTIVGGPGDDHIRGGAAGDVIDAGPGDDLVFGGRGADTIEGGDDDDTITGNNGRDVIHGGGGDDHIEGLNQPDTLFGDAGNDILWGGADDDTLRGRAGDDYLAGESGDDDVRGGDGDDELTGGFGDDALGGGAGFDSCIEGETLDTCESLGGPPEWVVTSTADSGPGTLRAALEGLQPGDVIVFDPTVFPPGSPATIGVTSALPQIQQDGVTIDASDAGVILDGSGITDGWIPGLEIVSNGTTIRGLRVHGFTGAGLVAAMGSGNTIGGDRRIGTGPFGRGNQVTGNGVGIGVWGQASDNVVTGNLVGTDASGTEDLGNAGVGMWVDDADHTTVGPDNVIAHNLCGIFVENLYGRSGTTIRGNSIHDDRGPGICRRGAVGSVPQPPVIIEFDTRRGRVGGITCPDCRVDVYSGDDDEGELFEIAGVADAQGRFAIARGAGFRGEHLTATATDPAGSTSIFTLPTHGVGGTLVMQAGNTSPGSQLQQQASGDLGDNRMNAQWDSFGIPELYDLGVYDRGVTRVRTAITGLEPELVDWSRDEWVVEPSDDDVFDRLAANGMTVTYVLMFWDEDVYPDGTAPCQRFKTEGEVQRYLDFVDTMVGHFGDRVEYFELWNEPDVPGYCPKEIEIADYIALAEAAIPVIRAADPDAKIVVGAVSPIEYQAASDWLFALLESPIMPDVDVISFHPMYGTSPGYSELATFYYQYPQIVQDIKDTAAAHGFSGEFQADEMTWPTVEQRPGFSWVYSPVVSAKYTARGILLHLGMDIGVGVTGDNPAVRNLAVLMDGAAVVDLPVDIQSAATDIVVYTFVLPDGDQYVVLWRDGVAVDADPGVPATVTITGVAATAVTGTEVVFGLQQELDFTVEAGNTVVRDLLVKDSPTIVRVTPAP